MPSLKTVQKAYLLPGLKPFKVTTEGAKAAGGPDMSFSSLAGEENRLIFDF